MDMVEKVAKAIATKALGEVGRDYDPFAIQKCIPYARAAIAAMREPTDEMLDAGSAAHPVGGYRRETLLNDIIECEWVAMCDAALEKK